MAIGVGVGVGLSIRYFGKGVDLGGGRSSEIIALFSCLLGDFFSIIGLVSNLEKIIITTLNYTHS